MKRMRVLILLAMAGVASVARAGGNEASTSIDRCWSAIVKEVRGKLAGETVFLGDVESSRSSLSERHVKGDGSYTTAKGEPTKFRFSCIHNTRSGDTYAVKIEPKEVQTVSGDPVQAAIDGCQRGVADELPDARNVHFVENRLKTASIDETGVDGNGQIRGADGKWTPFTYECTYSHLSNKAAVRVNLTR